MGTVSPATTTAIALALALATSSAEAQRRPAYPWPHQETAATLELRVAPPPGYTRTPAAADSFAAWLRRLPLKPSGAAVHLFDGSLKGNQTAHVAVLDIDTGARDLQQCADAVIRLRAEYLRASGREDDVCFRLTSGDVAPWQRWAAGDRPRVRGRGVSWSAGGPRSDEYAAFRRYLDFVFTYAGTFSLARDLTPAERVEIGDVFVQGGFPGHAVLVVDAAEDPTGKRVVLLAQSYMPAQEIHVLANPSGGGPWYPMPPGAQLATPEWLFKSPTPRRFPEPSACDNAGRGARAGIRNASNRSGTSARPR